MLNQASEASDGQMQEKGSKSNDAEEDRERNYLLLSLFLKAGAVRRANSPSLSSRLLDGLNYSSF